MGMWIGRNRKARVTYGFDEIALVPGEVTINPNEVDTSFQIPKPDGGQIKLPIPILASAMDGVTDVKFCIAMGKLGGLGVINLEGVQTRYEKPSEILEQIATADKDEVTSLIQKIYLAPIKEKLITRRIEELKAAGVLAAVSSIPQKAERFGAIAQKAGADGRLFGSVTNADIAESLGKQGLTVKKAEIRMPTGTLKHVGEFPIVIQLHSDVLANIVVHVVPEQ